MCGIDSILSEMPPFNWFYNHYFLIENDGFFLSFSILQNLFEHNWHFSLCRRKCQLHPFWIAKPSLIWCDFNGNGEKTKITKEYRQFKRNSSTRNVLLLLRYFLTSNGICHRFSTMCYLSGSFSASVSSQIWFEYCHNQKLILSNVIFLHFFADFHITQIEERYLGALGAIPSHTIKSARFIKSGKSNIQISNWNFCHFINGTNSVRSFKIVFKRFLLIDLQ